MGCVAPGSVLPLPSWFRQEIPNAAALKRMRGILQRAGLKTVCEDARCPNLGQCWKRGTATFMILGSTCTRACRFCAVMSGAADPVDPGEVEQVARAVKALSLNYVVITSVTRDDLEDAGARQFAQTVRAVKRLSPGCKVEVLIPDMRAREDLIKVILDANPDVLGHNVETVRRISPVLRPQADHNRSLRVLAIARAAVPGVMVKSGFMVGLGETEEEVLETFDELKAAGCQMVTVGQYLAPARDGRHFPAARYVPPEKFDEYRAEGMRRGLELVVAGPLVRSSYLAEHYFEAHSRKGSVA